jgi:hypothetical protein
MELRPQYGAAPAIWSCARNMELRHRGDYNIFLKNKTKSKSLYI